MKEIQELEAVFRAVHKMVLEYGQDQGWKSADFTNFFGNVGANYLGRLIAIRRVGKSDEKVRARIAGEAFKQALELADKFEREAIPR